mmetsp:Transcript_43427/g.114455  ORF Transcript_43427/g.114455 Transcript_43427/m.114455 type:complete len:702 (-) Transcript_43427:61-2166(-)|eukprot:CAMPEP_0194511448 /NCGR_PEP_ID=MMETSP0253-20130528/43130_1 /TAXON_ID=2966 /ORGANISM="Noctiluca scintillans" /LENGTH=701 /DNA_ID=CAMNT_0039354783 /DNA_START=34 /DNA_END=2139 /DNA_ORIENTATION=-
MKSCFFPAYVLVVTEAVRYVTDAGLGGAQSDEVGLPEKVSEQLDKVKKLEAMRASFEEELAGKELFNKQKDEEGRQEEVLQMQRIKEIQAERPKVQHEIARLVEQVEAQDAVRQRKVDAINEEMDVLEVHVDGHERPVVAKKSGEAVLEKMMDDVSREKSFIDEAVSQNLKSERDAAAVEASLQNRAKELEKQQKELAEQHASNTKLQTSRTEKENGLTHDLEIAASEDKDLDRQKEALSRKLDLNVEEQKNYTNQLMAVVLEKNQLENADVQKAKLLEEAVAKTKGLTETFGKAEQRLRWITRETQAKEQLVNTQMKELVSLQATLVTSKRVVEDSKREQLDTLKLAHEKEAAMEALQRTLAKAELGEVQHEADEEDKDQLHHEIQRLTMEGATLEILEGAKAEEKNSLEAQVEEVRLKLDTLKEELYAKQEAMQKATDFKNETQKQVATNEEMIANLTSQRSEIGSARTARISQMNVLSARIQQLSGDEANLNANISVVVKHQRKNEAEEKALNESLDELRGAFGETELVREKNKETNETVTQELEALPDMIKQAQLEQRRLQAERAEMQVQEELKANQENTVKKQLDSTRQEREKLAKAELEVQIPLQHKERERQLVLDIMGGTPAEKATLRELRAKVDAFNLQEKNAQNVVATLKRLSDERAHKLATIKKTFFKEQEKKEKFASERLERARRAGLHA